MSAERGATPAAHGFHLIVFDVDGTLVDSQHAIQAAMAAAFAAEGLPAPAPGKVRRQVGLGVEEAMMRLRPDADTAVRRRLAEAFRAAARDLRRQPGYHEPLYPGIREALDGLVHPAVLLGIATGKARHGLEHTLRSHRLDCLFHTLQTADRNPSKPHPAMLINAMAETGVSPAETVFIGDTVFDMAMANAAGTTGIGVAWGYHAADDLRAAGAHRIIREAAELGSVLKELGARTCG